jgi:glycosyltransferase involved in cell wall biosynthesis
MKKVLLLSYRLGYDSLLYWDSILTSLGKKFNLKVFTANDVQTTNDNSIMTENKITHLKYHKNPTHKDGKLYFFPLPFFIKDIVKYKPDVIVLNEFNLANFYTLIFRFLYKNTKFLLLVESDPGLGINKFKKNSIRYYYRKFIANNVDLIQTNNELGKNYLIDHLDILVNKIITKPYLMSMPEFNSGIPIKLTKKINFLFVGQIIQRKGINYFLESLILLEKKLKERIEVTIIGDGDLKDDLEIFIKKNNLSFVNFTGKIPFEELSSYYINADYFVLPTLHDYRALVGFEALFFGCAIIDSIYDGARFEVVEEGINGFIIDPLDIEKFKNTLEKIILNPNMIEVFKRKSLEKSKEFNIDKCNSNLINTISNM